MAERIWYGGATSVPQQDEVQLAGTYATGDTVTLTVESKSLTLTIGTDTSLATIITELYNMCVGNAIANTGYSRTNTGDEVGLFAILAYQHDGVDKLTVTGPDDGRPYTMTAAVVSTLGTIAYTKTRTATGPHHFDNAQNWGGTLPVDGDTLIFDHRSAYDLRYALTQNTLTPDKIIVARGFAQAIGLPDIYKGTTAALNFPEYLETDLVIGDPGDVTPATIDITVDAPLASKRIRFDTGGKQAALTVHSTGSREDTETPVLLWKGGHSANTVTLYGGDLGIAIGPDESATVSTISVPGSTDSRYAATLTLGENVTITSTRVESGTVVSRSSLGNLSVLGGTVTAYSGVTDLDVSGGTVDVTLTATLATLTMSAGTLTISGTITTANVYGGTVTLKDGGVTNLTVESATFSYLGSGTCTTLVVREGGTIDFSKDLQSRTVTDTQLYVNAGYKDPYGTVTHTNGIQLVHCSAADLRTFEIPSNTRVTLAPL